jgi:hypothetical protein
MEESILTTTKKILNIAPGDGSFDLDVITHINSAFGVLWQLGIGGPDGAFWIADAAGKWTDMGLTPEMENQVKTYIFLKCKLIFDPPQTSFTLRALQDQIQEHEVRLNVMRESTEWADPMPPRVPADA